MNEAAERVRERLGVFYREPIERILFDAASLDLDAAIADERKATVERITAQVDEYIAAFPSRNRTVFYGAALALRERLAQMSEQYAEAAK